MSLNHPSSNRFVSKNTMTVPEYFTDRVSHFACLSIKTSVSIGDYVTAIAMTEASAERILASGWVEILGGVPK